MTEKNYLITMTGTQSYGGDDNTDIEMITECCFTAEDGRYFVEYDETEASGMAGTSTTVETDGEFVSISRAGTVSTTLLFIKGRQTTGYYDTPYGTMMMGIITDSMDISLTPEGGRIYIKYTLSMNNLFSGLNTLEMQIKRGKRT